MIKTDYDIIVVGAGPAGAVTALHAAKAGAKVLILERDREPGIPVRCAEGLASKEIPAGLELDKSWIASYINKTTMESPDGTKLHLDEAGDGYILHRRLFDAGLCERALAAGADLLTKADVSGLIYSGNHISGVKTTLQGVAQEFTCRLVIGADGVESRVGRWAGINTTLKLGDLHTSYQYTLGNLDVHSGTIQFMFGQKYSPGGYVWVFPKSNQVANVGMGMPAARVNKTTPRQYLDAFVAARFPGSKRLYSVCGAVPTSRGLKNIVADGVMLVGDAARQVHPATGGGIGYSLLAGSICGRVAAKAVASGDFSTAFLKEYEKEWRQLRGKGMQLLHAIKELFFGMEDAKMDDLFKAAAQIPPQERNSRSLFMLVAKENPLLLAKLGAAVVKSKMPLV